MKIRFDLDTVAGGVLAALAVMIGAVILLGNAAGVRVSVDLPKDGLVSPLRPIRFTFSEPVDFEMISSVVSLDPVQEGYLEWLDPRSIQYTPIQPYLPDTVYRIAISPDVVARNGHSIKKPKYWEFSARDPLVAFLSPNALDSSIWSVDLNGNPPVRLTGEGISVISFTAAPGGDFLVYTIINERGGVDLWRVSREGNDDAVLLDCGLDRCTRTAISPNSRYIAYTRESPGIGSDLPFGSPRIWVLDLQTGQNSPVYEDPQILGYNLSWSPDSTKLTSFDGLADLIRIIDLKNNDQYSLASNTGGPVAWSPDSTQLLFTNLVQAESGMVTQVRIADVTIGESQVLIGEQDQRDHSYYSLAWSLREDRALLSFRAGAEQPEQVFWVFDPSTLDGIVIASQTDYTYNSPQWNPWGDGLVFQRFKLRGPYNPEIALWQLGFSEPRVLVQGLMPHWLP